MINKIGHGNSISIEQTFDSLNKKKLDEKELGNGLYCELFSVEFGNHNRVYLRGKHPSDENPFFSAVPPTCLTVQDALDFRNGIIKMSPLKRVVSYMRSTCKAIYRTLFR